VILETDGWAAHGTRHAFEDDRARDADRQARGYAVLRFTWRQIESEPAKVVALLAATLARRA
jgi:very-short-patch-repair endonuclease